METKKCGCCNLIKSKTEFGIHKRSSDGLRWECKSCKNEKSRIYRLNNIQKVKETQKKYRDNNRDKEKEYREKNKQTISQKQKEYRENNKEIISIYQKEYREENKEKIIKYREENKELHRKYAYNNYINNPLTKLKNSISCGIRRSLKNGKSKKTIEVLGCSLDFFKKYIEDKFLDGMNWDNHSKYGWHLDHIIPISSARNEEEIYKLNHYTNFQPLWASDNLSKSNKILI